MHSLGATTDEAGATWGLLKASLLPGNDETLATIAQAATQIRDWRTFFRRADFASVGVCVDRALSAVVAQLPRDVEGAITKRQTNRRARHVMALAELGAVVAAFKREGIRFTYLKGFSYPGLNGADPLGREMADIDLLVSPSQLAQAHGLLQNAGYRPELPFDRVGLRALTCSNFNHTVYLGRRTAMPVELHWRLKEADLCQANANAYFMGHSVESRIGPLTLPTFDRPTLTMMTALHGARHGWFRLRWVADLASLLETMSEDERRRTLALCKELGAERTLAATLSLLQMTLGRPLSQELLAFLERHPEAPTVGREWAAMVQEGALAGTSDAEGPMKRRVRSLYPRLMPSHRRRWSVFVERYVRLCFSAAVVMAGRSSAHDLA